MPDSSLGGWLALWMVAAAFVVLFRLRQHVPSTGLILGYIVIFWLNYWPGALVSALPWFNDYDPQTVELGFRQCVYAVCAFALAAAIAIPLGRRTVVAPTTSAAHLPRAYLIVGMISYPLVSSTIGRLPTVRAVISTGTQLMVVGLCLLCWTAWKSNDRRKFAAALAGAFALPLVTVVTQGYLGYGTIPALIVLVFALGLIRLRAGAVTAGIIVVYCAVSVFVTYMRDRGEIRSVVWAGGGYSERLDSMQGLFTQFEWFDPWNQEHLARIESRLNQSRLVGMAVKRLDGTDNYGYGETLWDAVLALIPRAVWPEKTVSAGSGDVVSRYTGFQYTEETSVGIGQVLEFYINFGSVGVVCGFFAMGVLLTVIDMAAAHRLAAGDMKGFVLWFLPGFALLQVGGSLVEVTASAATSVFVAVAVNRLVDRIGRRTAKPHNQELLGLAARGADSL